MTVRLSERSRKSLEKLAKHTARSKSFLASEAIDAYLEANAWQVEEIKRALHEARKPNARFIPHEKVERWARSLGSGKELRKPTA